jgi:hypothetical protein
MSQIAHPARKSQRTSTSDGQSSAKGIARYEQSGGIVSTTNSGHDVCGAGNGAASIESANAIADTSSIRPNSGRAS